jgi:predicted DsbA family dithiol-disulfide isomerase
VADRVDLVIWSDYLCPWCYVAAIRMRRVEEEFAGRVGIEWRSFLLRPYPDPTRTLERFRSYTQSWRRPAAEPDAPVFRPWSSGEGPPSHSVPAHVVAKAAAALGGDAFRALHGRLLEAYFAESRDITDAGTLRALWGEVGLPGEAFALSSDGPLLSKVLAEHEEATRLDITGVPAVLMVGNDVPIVGAMPYETYRRWIERQLAGTDRMLGRLEPPTKA